MRTRSLVSITLAASVLISGPNVFAKTASCPCSPCKCSPCTCGAGGSKGGKRHEKEGHEHGGVGVGVNVDLGGVGQRKAEPNPFGTTNQPSTSTTHEKTTTKKHTEQTTATTFDKVELTTDKAKDLETSETGTGGGPPVAGGAINVANDTPTPTPQTQEKKKKVGKKKKKKWPKPIQDWVDAKKAAETANLNKDFEWQIYEKVWRAPFLYENKHYVEVKDRAATTREKAEKPGATQEDKDNADKAQKELDQLTAELDKDFQKTPEGQKAFKKVTDAEKAADAANAAEKDAGKNIDQATKDSVQEEEKKAVQDEW